MKIDKIIEIIRDLNEDGPTVSIGSGIAAGADKHIAGMVGEPPVRKRKKTPKGHVGSRVPWLQYLRNK